MGLIIENHARVYDRYIHDYYQIDRSFPQPDIKESFLFAVEICIQQLLPLNAQHGNPSQAHPQPCTDLRNLMTSEQQPGALREPSGPRSGPVDSVSLSSHRDIYIYIYIQPGKLNADCTPPDQQRTCFRSLITLKRSKSVRFFLRSARSALWA